MAASFSAATCPMPDVPPVITTVFPRIALLSREGILQHGQKFSTWRRGTACVSGVSIFSELRGENSAPDGCDLTASVAVVASQTERRAESGAGILVIQFDHMENGR